MKINREFFERDTRVVARDLLGMEIVYKVGRKTISGIITETEAYRGFADRASHASRGKTARNAPMFGPPGTLYIYLVYGMHWCLNIVTEREEFPAAVLIRGVWVGDAHYNGPGKFTRAFGITKTLNGENIIRHEKLFLTGKKEMPSKIKRMPRIGVAYAGDIWAHKPWRYLIY